MAYCSRCGNELQKNAAFCSKCGAPASAATATATAAAAAPSSQYGYEKQEKREKREKEVRQAEKYEKRQMGGDSSAPLIGGAILILLGVIYYASLTTPRLIPAGQELAYFIVGFGLILIAHGLYRQVSMKQRASMGSLYGGIILIAIGGAGVVAQGNIWPFVLIGVGIIIIIVVLRGRARAPRP